VQNSAFSAYFFVAKCLISLQNTTEKSALSERADKEVIFIFFAWRIINMAKKAAKGKESLVVASKVRAYIKSKKMMTSSDALGALNDKLYCLLDHACERTKANRRSTLKPQDL
jgi:hypothetical protein